MILDECSHMSATEEILNGNSKFFKLDIPAGKEINYIINLEKRNYRKIYLQKYKASRY